MELLKIIADNEPLYQALSKLLYDATVVKPDLTLSDKDLGERVRGQEMARRAIDLALIEIARHKTRDEQDRPRNPAR